MQVYVALTVAGVAALMDLKWEKVKNSWIVAGWSMAFALYLAGCVPGHPIGYVAGGLLPIMLLFPLFIFRMLGPGDIKILSALGAVMGFPSIMLCMLYSLFIGGILSLGILLIGGDFIPRLRHFVNYIHTTLTQQVIQPYYRIGAYPENIHFTVPIFLSVLLYAGGIY